MDRETILASVNKTGRAVVLHEAPKTCGLGAEIAASIAKRLLSAERTGGAGHRPGHHGAPAQERGPLLSRRGAGPAGGPQAHGVLTWPKSSVSRRRRGHHRGRDRPLAGQGGRRGPGRPALAEIETDKAIVEMPSPYAARCSLDFKEEGPGQGRRGAWSTIGAKGEAWPRPARSAAAPTAAAGPGPARHRPGPAAPRPAGDDLATPHVRPWPGRSASTSPPSAARARTDGSPRTTSAPLAGPGRRRRDQDQGQVRSLRQPRADPLRGIRRATAKKMRESLDHAAHVTHATKRTPAARRPAREDEA